MIEFLDHYAFFCETLQYFLKPYVILLLFFSSFFSFLRLYPRRMGFPGPGNEPSPQQRSEPQR